MSRKLVRALGALLLFALLLAPLTALAHETVTAGDYNIEFGWLNEPSVVGQPNAVVINIGQADEESFADVDVSGLKIEVVYGPESKTLDLQPLGEDTPGQFIAPLTPTRAGEYTVRLTGKIGDSDVNVEVKPEEVQTADVVQFPSVAVESPKLTNTFGLSGWLAVAGVILGLLGIGLGAAALQRKK